MQAAACELRDLAPYGLQLTPGNAPTDDFAAWLSHEKIPTLSHHGFCWQALRQKVWNPLGNCIVAADSVHPPQLKEPCTEYWWDYIETHQDGLPMLETMYPGYLLGTGQEIEKAMNLGLRLAVDVSHLHIQWHQGVLTSKTLKRLQDYHLIGEIHLSDNSGSHDSHQPLQADSFGLDWARERSQQVPLVLECYMHRMEHPARLAQIALCHSN